MAAKSRGDTVCAATSFLLTINLFHHRVRGMAYFCINEAGNRRTVSFSVFVVSENRLLYDLSLFHACAKVTLFLNTLSSKISSFKQETKIFF